MSMRIRQQGLSMIELLVALAIGSFLILGITQVYLDNKRNYSFQLSQGYNQENIRFAEYVLDNWLGKAGYRRTPDQMYEFAFPELPASDDCKAFAEGATVTELKSSSGEKGFCIRYQPAHLTERDCQGDPVKAQPGTSLDDPFVLPAKEEVVVSAIRFVPSDDLHKGSLQCKNLSSAGTAAFVELVDGVADFKVEFAVGVDDVLEKRIKDDPWVSEVTGSQVVRSVRYSILLGSEPNRRDGDSEVIEHWLSAVAAQTDKQRIEPNDKRRIYQTASSVVSVRNMMP